MNEAKYTVKQAAWEAAGFDGNPTPQPLMEVNPRSGCMMLAFPHHWWQPDEVELAYVPVTISLGEIPPELSTLFDGKKSMDRVKFYNWLNAALD